MQPTGCILLVIKYNLELNNQANFVGIVFMVSVFDRKALLTLQVLIVLLHLEQITN